MSPAQAQSTVAGLDERVTSAGGRMCKQGQGDTEERAGGAPLRGRATASGCRRVQASRRPTGGRAGPAAPEGRRLWTQGHRRQRGCGIRQPQQGRGPEGQTLQCTRGLAAQRRQLCLAGGGDPECEAGQPRSSTEPPGMEGVGESQRAVTRTES